MKRKFLSLLLIFIYLLSLFSITSSALFIPSSASEDTNKNALEIREENAVYHYEVTTSDKKWREFNNLNEMLCACRIDKEALEALTTDQLLCAVLDFPLIVNVLLYNSMEQGIEELAIQSDAFKALTNRPDAALSISNLLSAYKELKTEPIEILYLQALLLDKEIAKQLEIIESSQISTASNVSATTYVQTPKGSNVQVFNDPEQMTPAAKLQLDSSTVNTYPNATFLSSSTTIYNCHSYAWYLQSTSNPYWMNNPALYMSDGSYTKVTSASGLAVGAKWYTSSKNHSAVIYSFSLAHAQPFQQCTVTSKWGQGPVMRHTANYGPYTDLNPTVWKR